MFKRLFKRLITTSFVAFFVKMKCTVLSVTTRCVLKSEHKHYFILLHVQQISDMAAAAKINDDIEDGDEDKDADWLCRQHENDCHIVSRCCSRFYRFHISVSFHQVHSDICCCICVISRQIHSDICCCICVISPGTF